jgi:hypothetical protein
MAVIGRINEQGPSKYEFEGPYLDRVLRPSDFSGLPRHVQCLGAHALLPEHRLSLSISIQSDHPIPPALGTFQVLPETECIFVNRPAPCGALAYF